MSTPNAPPLTTSSFTQVPAGKKIDFAFSNVDPFAIWSLWISISASTSSRYNLGVQSWGASIVDRNTGQTMLRCQLHLPGPNQHGVESVSLWLGGLVMATHNAPFEITFETDPGVKEMYTKANGGLYYGVVAP